MASTESWQFDQAQQTLTDRFCEFMELHRFLVKKAKRYHLYGTSVRLVIIILGAVSAAQATVKDKMGEDFWGIILFFTILAILMTIAAGFESFFKWDHKSGAFYSLAAICATSLYRIHDEWHKEASEYVAKPSPHQLDKVLELADRNLEAINSKIVDIHNRAAELGVPDLALTLPSLDPRDMFNVALAQTKKQPLSDGDGRPAEATASCNHISGESVGTEKNLLDPARVARLPDLQRG